MSNDPESDGMATSGQLRAARAYLGWSLVEAAFKSARSVSVVCTAEDAARIGNVADLVPAIMRTYEAAGITFLTADAAGPGVRLKGDGG